MTQHSEKTLSWTCRSAVRSVAVMIVQCGQAKDCGKRRHEGTTKNVGNAPEHGSPMLGLFSGETQR